MVRVNSIVDETGAAPWRAAAQPASLAHETRAALGTAEAARHLCRSQNTLRIWACKETGPIRPLRVNGRLMWPVPKLRELLGVEAP